MTVGLSASELDGGPVASLPADYQPGVCNIGPEEIARRRRAGHIGAVVTAIVLIGLVAVDAPPAARLLVGVPAAVAAVGYLQAHLRFCAAYGSRGVFNFGSYGSTRPVLDRDAHRRDRERSAQIGLASAAIGLGVGIAAALLPF